MTDDQIVAACATAFERRFLSGNGYAVGSASYTRNRVLMLQEIRARYEARRIDQERRQRALVEVRQITTLPTDRAGREALGRTMALAYNVSVILSAAIPASAYAYSSWTHRRITMPPDWAASAKGLAAFTHEVAHILEGRCPNTGLHRRDTTAQRWWNCLACETAATDRALRLLPFTREMFDRMRDSLRSYRRQTAAPLEAKEAARQAESDSYFAARVLARLEHEQRLAAQAEIEALACPVLSRQERQRQEIQAIAKEAGL